MRIFSVALTLALSVPAQAFDVTAPVPGHPGMTLLLLLKQATPGLVHDQSGNWTVSMPFRQADGSMAPTDFAFQTVDVLTVLEHGQKRIILLTGDSQIDGSFSAILAAYDNRSLKLLDAGDGGGDRFVMFSAPATLAIANDSQAFLVTTSHFNSNQNYTGETLYYLDGGKLKVALSQFTLNQGFCGYEMRQVPHYSVQDDPGSAYRAILVRVRQTITHTDETCDNGTTIPKAGTAVFEALYHYSAVKKGYVTTSRSMGHVMAPD